MLQNGALPASLGAIMFDDLPAPLIVTLAAAIAAFVPTRYVLRYLATAPSRRDITQPPNDDGWRDRGTLYWNAALVVGLTALAVFAWTPAAATFARSAVFTPLVMAGLGAIAMIAAARAWVSGSVTPLLRGNLGPYDRTTMPRRYWTSLAYNAVIGGGLLFAGLHGLWDIRDETCRGNTNAGANEVIAACSVLLAEADDDAARRAALLFHRGYAQHRDRRSIAAMRDYSAALRLDPRDSYALYNRSILFREFGQRDRALRDLDASLAIRPDNAAGHGDRGGILLELADHQGAVRAFDMAERHGAEAGFVNANRAVANAWRGDRTAVEADLARVPQDHSLTFVAMHARAIMAMREGSTAESMRHLSEAIRLKPDNPWALDRRRQSYLDLGDTVRAEADDARLRALAARIEADRRETLR